MMLQAKRHSVKPKRVSHVSAVNGALIEAGLDMACRL